MLGVVPANVDIGSIDFEFIDDPDPKINKASVKGAGDVSLTGAPTAIAHAVSPAGAGSGSSARCENCHFAATSGDIDRHAPEKPAQQCCEQLFSQISLADNKNVGHRYVGFLSTFLMLTLNLSASYPFSQYHCCEYNAMYRYRTLTTAREAL